VNLTLARKVIKLIEFLCDQKLPRTYEDVEQIKISSFSRYELLSKLLSAEKWYNPYFMLKFEWLVMYQTGAQARHELRSPAGAQ
jgi:hypothetical protein